MKPKCVQNRISIHALRVEGDFAFLLRILSTSEFLSTPSGWRATRPEDAAVNFFVISIHALRVEGDIIQFDVCRVHTISIHALRVEGDSKNGQSFHLFLRKREKNLPL